MDPVLKKMNSRYLQRQIRQAAGWNGLIGGYIVGVAVFFVLRSVSVSFSIRQMTKAKSRVDRIKYYIDNYNNLPEENVSEQNKTIDEESIKERMKKVRLLCLVPTGPTHFLTRDSAVKQTWGKRCDILLFMTAKADPFLPTVGLNITEGWKYLTSKTMAAFRYVLKNHFDDADWFMKVDDDTFVIVENLRYFLASQNTEEPVFYGHHYSYFVKQGYNGGGAGYVLSKEALRRFGKLKYNECREEGGAEDLEMGKCMEKIGVVPGRTLDAFDRLRFHTYSAESHVTGALPTWVIDYDAYGIKKGVENASDRAISFHYTKPHALYESEFFIYSFRPHGNRIRHNAM